MDPLPLSARVLAFLRRRGIAVLTALFVCLAFAGLFREPWFDEVLTLDLIQKRPGLIPLYTYYRIPNNHVLFTLLLYLWGEWLPPILIRFLPFGIALAGLFFFRKRIRSSFAGFLAAACLILSPVFLNFATAMRGYILGFVLVAAAFGTVRGYVRSGQIRRLAGYFLLSLAALGTAPTNLAGLAAAVLFFLPGLMRRDRWKRLIPLTLLPGAALVLFYWPVRHDFIACMSLAEGWHSRAGSAGNLYAALALVFLPLWWFALKGAAIRLRDPRTRWYVLSGLAVFLLPLAAILTFRMPLFPRVFFPLFGVWVWLIAGAVRTGLRGTGSAGRFRLVLVVLVWTAVFGNGAAAISGALFGEPWHDDLIAPYYQRIGFTPLRTAETLNRIAAEDPLTGAFLTFNSDYPSILFASAALNAAEGNGLSGGCPLLYDHANEPPLTELPPWNTVLVVVRSDDELDAVRARFGLPYAAERLPGTGMQKVYRFRRRP